jgi:hypothetical protein
MSVTPNQLVQYAANIAGPIQTTIQNGQYEDVYKTLFDLAAAVIALCDATNGNLGSTPVAVTTVAIGTQYSATATLPYNVVTSVR